MSWRRSLAISGLALVFIGVWPRVRAQPDASKAAPATVAKPTEVKPGGAARARTTTKLKPQHSLADAGVGDAGAHFGDASQHAGDAGDAGVAAGDASVDAGPPPEPPLDEEALIKELPPANDNEVHHLATAASTTPEGPPYGRQKPLMNHVRLDGHVALNWEGGFGVGARVDWLLIEGTFRYRKRDELALSAGADVMFVQFSGSNYTDVYPTVVLQWSIGVNDRWFLYPEFGLLGHVQRGEWEGLYPNLGFGARYYIKRSVGIQARFGWPVALSAGAVF